jgi:hypothetical protein
MNDELDASQLRFENGSLVKGPEAEGTPPEDHTADPIKPEEETGFVVEVKSGALEVNCRLREAVEVHGRTLDFGSRQQAENYASQLSASDGSVRIQASPDNEPRDIDAYLLADHDPSIKEPADVDGDTWTFDVGANLYGSLGEAILLESPKPHALIYFVRQDLDVDDDDLEWGLNVDVTPGQPLAVDSSNGAKRWTPDCVVKAKDGWDEVLEQYYCEIKTGDASFERSQVEAMEGLASDERVLKIRVGIDDLPDQYSIRIHEVGPSG